ncbi:conserved hypothetical protein (DUF1343) [Formosa agariphila KMM 3901]|uniref:DUF1343 domain-containing protein n=1 Tax=Formosa agariphila (strain DSM 15362 / KCTC 12365 / LMG 23005 / KMM 3901 / M-2Alg 35-1) TaxID=1347342 RepID=T2KMK9_FORAG|nr:DUF1343 domain-containing protein [Formosa agariphila]CDF79698.1 conserved hypothetical protein (DUF1343) [Formosa agariphila KMM 3901]
MKTHKLLSRILLIVFSFSLLALSCKNSNKNKNFKLTTDERKTENIIVAANQTEKYLELLKGKNIAVAVNNTSVIFKNDSINSFEHLVDSLLSLEIKIKKMFAPEHGVRGIVNGGKKIENGLDEKTGLEVVSLYGDNYKPNKEQLKNIDLVLFDIQDVGARFYTYLSTMHYIMEACAENNIPVIVLDRPNPNGHYIDGPIVEPQFKSFVGLHPVPIVYGMTIGEYAKMINGEKWLKNKVQCDLTVIPLQNYTHNSTYTPPLRPSPNLPNDISINLYPSLCLFEGTNVSCGRGTETPLQMFGSPFLNKDKYTFSFIPQPNFGANNPKNKNQICFGLDLSKEKRLSSLNLNWLINAYHATDDKDQFFSRTEFFNKLAGTDKLKKQIEEGLTFDQIKANWQDDLIAFKKIREKYLIY